MAEMSEIREQLERSLAEARRRHREAGDKIVFWSEVRQSEQELILKVQGGLTTLAEQERAADPRAVAFEARVARVRALTGMPALAARTVALEEAQGEAMAYADARGLLSPVTYFLAGAELSKPGPF